jgi:hypothetical protein
LPPRKRFGTIEPCFRQETQIRDAMPAEEVRQIMEKIPLWSTAADNLASRRLAQKIGFAEYAEVISVTL